MLSPHEIAALILVKDAPNPEELDPMAIDTLLAHRYVTLENRPSGQACPRLTQRGDSLLKAVGRFR
ncbi:Preprotein translocase subunit SecA (plasmid) [Cupriavidus necator]